MQIVSGGKLQMTLRVLIAIVIFGLMFVQPSDAAVRIQDDMGGRLGDYLIKYSSVRNSGQLVIIDGRCYSACTLVTGSIPKKNICVTSRAELGFHAAATSDRWGSFAANSIMTRIMYNLYPRHIQNWLNRHGGLGPRLVVLSGRDLAQMYPACPQNADLRF